MKTIAEARENVANIWGKQRQKETDYRPLLYLVRAECDEGTLILNTVTGQMILLTAEELSALDALPGPLPQILQPLMEAHFVVPVDSDEKKSVQQLRAISLQKMNRKKEITSYTILPTTACNARCFYCYEANYAHHSMTEETADQLVEFITAHCGPEKEVYLDWFGGEPLVGKTRIDQICAGLRDGGVNFTSSMTSNSYLFTKELAQHAVDDWHLDFIQVTLDGTEDVYNKAKAYVNVSGSPYRRVLDNIGYLLQAGVTVEIRLNLDRYNAENLKLLIAELADCFPGQSRLSVYCHILFENMGFVPVTHTGDEMDRLETVYDEIELLLRAKGLSRPSRNLPSLELNHCMADNPRSLLVNPLGEFGKCDHGVQTNLVGNIAHGITAPDEVKEWAKHKEYPLCSRCRLYPACIHLARCAAIRDCTELTVRRELAAAREAMLLRWKSPDYAAEDERQSCS